MFLNSYHHSLFYIGITKLSICVFFISLLQSVNEAKLLNTTSIPLLPPPADNAETV